LIDKKKNAKNSPIVSKTEYKIFNQNYRNKEMKELTVKEKMKSYNTNCKNLTIVLTQRNSYLIPSFKRKISNSKLRKLLLDMSSKLFKIMLEKLQPSNSRLSLKELLIKNWKFLLRDIPKRANSSRIWFLRATKILVNLNLKWKESV